MTTDKELLELAAKAAGIVIGLPLSRGGFDNQDGYWNPLTDDGDALRLAVKLNLKTTYDSLSDGAIVEVSIPWDNEHFDEDYHWMEWLNKDPYAATRRAIVRAAAEIGKELNDE